MDNQTCPMTQRELIKEYFMEYRAKLLDVAAFLDRMDRAAAQDADHDFRFAAFRQSLEVLCSDDAERVERIQMLLSDPNTDLMDERDQQNAFGAFPHRNGIKG
jgi:hypothetical protein